MVKYVALLRGIGPGNPNMHNEKLKGVFENLSFENVQTVISSGNVLFESDATNPKLLEEKIEKALPEQLGFKSTTIIRKHEDLQKLVQKNPFKKIDDLPKGNLNITFLKNLPKENIEKKSIDGKGYKIVGIYDREICSQIDLNMARTPDLMGDLEKKFGKEITTRTWNSVKKILGRMELMKA